MHTSSSYLWIIHAKHWSIDARSEGYASIVDQVAALGRDFPGYQIDVD
ncbi:MAG TPA: hypothetical protein VGH27_34375 [Streptosporangiaceae bacterium]|jgi:hypothetical protein